MYVLCTPLRSCTVTLLTLMCSLFGRFAARAVSIACALVVIVYKTALGETTRIVYQCCNCYITYLYNLITCSMFSLFTNKSKSTTMSMKFECLFEFKPQLLTNRFPHLHRAQD